MKNYYEGFDQASEKMESKIHPDFFIIKAILQNSS
jgi:hypothetical protein